MARGATNKKGHLVGWLSKIWPFSRNKGNRVAGGGDVVDKRDGTNGKARGNYRERLARAEKVMMEKCHPKQVWLMILYVAAVRDNEAENYLSPLSPKEMIQHLEMVGKVLENRPELKREVWSAQNKDGGAHTRLHLTAELFNYWRHNGTTKQEVSGVFSQMLSFDWLFPDGALSIVQSLPPGLLFEATNGKVEVQNAQKSLWKDWNIYLIRAPLTVLRR